MGGCLRSLQVLRFVAAFGVVYAHATLNFAHNLNGFGGMGVDVFFVISGFIITRAARRNPEHFLRNRAVRVLPMYYLAALPWFLAGHDVKRMIATVTLWPAFDTFSAPLLVVGWSLCYEALFYVAVWLVLRGVKPWLLGLAFAAAFGLSWTGLVVFQYLGSPLILEFLAGVGLALSPFRSRLLGVVALVGGVLMVTWFVTHGTYGLDNYLIGRPGSLWRLVWGLNGVLWVFAATQLEWDWGKLPVLGDASYAIYLTHPLVIAVVVAMGWAPSAWAVIALCVAVGLGAYLFVERPLLGLIRSSWPAPRPVAVSGLVG